MDGNRPLEFYGQSLGQTVHWQTILNKEYCPFLQKKCVKVRKSDPEQSIGACILGYGSGALIVCPHRLLQHDRVFLDMIPLIQRQQEYYIIPEVAMPGGTIDYFLVAMDGVTIADYIGLETQSLDTTASGAIWEARNDLLRGRYNQYYKYGINWKMSAKTILVQMHHKANVFEGLGRKLVLVIQREFFEYVTKVFRTRHLHEASENDSIHFHIYDCVVLNNQFNISLVQRRSTDVRGIEEMLNLREATTISESEVIEKIRAKLPMARRLSA